MSVLPANANFQELVQDCFTVYRARGVALSALEVELLERWSTLGVPFEVISRGLRAAALAARWDARSDEGPLKSLRSARRHVEAEIAKFQARTPSKEASAETPPSMADLDAERRRRLLRAVRSAAKEHPTLTVVWEQLKRSSSRRLDELAVALTLRALPPKERRTLEREARQLAESRSFITARARRDRRRFHRYALVRERFGLPTFW